MAAIGRALDVTALPGETSAHALARFLAPKELLLVLDNLEHLLGAAPAIGELLATCPELVVLATAREPLRLQAETRYLVAPLEPAAARALFTERARRQDAHAELETEVIARICDRLDGLPLAIELAAARLALLGARELARRIDGAALALGTAARDAPARQQTLRATLDWSFRLLTETEQEAFVRLAVFAGGCTIEAAELVTGASLDALESLVAKCLLMRSRTDHGEPRLLMLATVREYGMQRLAARDDAELLRRRHAQYYLDLAERSEPHLRGAGR
jgi:predicted ATPase